MISVSLKITITETAKGLTLATKWERARFSFGATMREKELITYLANIGRQAMVRSQKRLARIVRREIKPMERIWSGTPSAPSVPPRLPPSSLAGWISIGALRELAWLCLAILIALAAGACALYVMRNHVEYDGPNPMTMRAYEQRMQRGIWPDEQQD